MEQALKIYLRPEGSHFVPLDTPLSKGSGYFPEHDMEVFRPLPEYTGHGVSVVFPIKNLHRFVPPEWMQPHIEHVWYYAHRRCNRIGPYFNHSVEIGETLSQQFDPLRSGYLGGISVHLESRVMLTADGEEIDYSFLGIDIDTPTIAEAAAWLTKVEHVQHPSDLPSEFRYLGELGKPFKKSQ